MGSVTRRSVGVRREEILDATLEQVVRLGLASTRVSDVSEALGISSALVFYHFGTKDDLLAEAFGHAVDQDLERLDKAAARSADPVRRLAEVVRRYGPTGSAVGWRLWIDAWAVAQREPEISKVLRRMDVRWCAVFLDIIEAGVKEGAFTCEDPPASVVRISALLDGLSVATLVYRTVTRSQLRKWIAEAVASEVGVSADKLL